jgi:hypothetical protein
MHLHEVMSKELQGEKYISNLGNRNSILIMVRKLSVKATIEMFSNENGFAWGIRYS